MTSPAASQPRARAAEPTVDDGPAPLDRTLVAQSPGPAWSAAWSAAVDDALTDRLHHAQRPGGVAIVALGSFARRQLCPASDVDVLLLHDGWQGGDLESLVRSVCYPLWDAGLSVGHHVATPREAVRAASGSLETATALIERRLVTGDSGLLDGLAGRVDRFVSRRRASLMADLTTAGAARRERDGSEPGMLEPDLKTGAGGLRDLDSLGWAAATLLGEPTFDALVGAGYLGAAEVSRLRAARATLLRVRVALHLVLGATRPGRGVDRLRLDLQDEVAAALGSASSDHLLREVGLATRLVRHVHERTWPRLAADGRRGRRRRGPGPGRVVDRGIVLTDEAVETTSGASVHTDPSLPLRVLAVAAQRGAHVARTTAASMAREITAVGEVAWTAASRSALLVILRSGESAVPAFRDGDHMGLWQALLPDWSRVRGHPQRNPYHRFDLDTHLLRSVVELTRVAGGAIDERHEAVAERLTEPEVLLLATFLHDIGKPWPGDHAVVGAQQAHAWVMHMGFGAHRADAVAHLVRHHLLLPEVATSRDLDDAREIARVAELVGSPETVDHLLLLSVADARATGPSAFSPWKEGLLSELHARVRAHLHGGESAWTRASGPAVVVADARRVMGPAVDAFLDGLPRTYLLAADCGQVVEHARLADDAGSDAVRPDGHARAAWRPGPARGTAVVSVVAADRRGLVADCAGLLAASGVTVLDARAFTRDDGVAFEWFVVQRADRSTGEELDLDRVVADMRRITDPTLDVGARLARRERRRDERLAEPLPDVEVSAERGPRRARIDVRAPDAPGMLSRLAREIADAGLDLDAARVATLTGQVRDVFWVRLDHDVDLDTLVERLRGAVGDAVSATGRRLRSSA